MNLAEKVNTVYQRLFGTTNGIVAAVITILVFTVLYYYMIKFLFDNDSSSLVMLFVFVMVIAAAILTVIPGINTSVYLLVPVLFIVAILILYSVEIKRLLWARRNTKMLDAKHGEGISYDEDKVQRCIVEIIKALQNMSKNDVGAILVLSTGSFPTQILDSGVRLDSDISSELIESVFFPKTPLHDGAMIISGTKITAAGCFLPLSQNIENIPKDLGTRHRAGIGVTETIDVMSIIVSEETGVISIARAGKITRYADTEALKKTLAKYYWQELESARK